jgi:hypothetical protein
MIQLSRPARFVIFDSPVWAAHGAVDQTHQERRRDAMARDIAHEEGISLTWQRDDVKKVAANTRRRKTFGGDVNARRWRAWPGQKILLYLARQIDLCLELLSADVRAEPPSDEHE